MKACSVVVLAIAFGMVTCGHQPYPSRFDNIDPNTIVGSPRLLEAYIDCFLGDKPCNADMKTARGLIPDAVQTVCQRCNAKQRHLIREFIKASRHQFPLKWERLLDKHDPRRQRMTQLDHFLRMNN